jgi:hypothetical protein
MGTSPALCVIATCRKYFALQNLGFGVWGWGFGYGVYLSKPLSVFEEENIFFVGSAFENLSVQGLGFRIWASGFSLRVQGFGVRVSSLGFWG